MDAAPAGLEVTDLWKSYRDRPALHGVTLAVRPGELVGLVGHNGAGKTTLLRCAAGLLRCDKGTVVAGGAPAFSVAARKLIGYLPEEPALYPALTVGEHLQFIARAYRVPDWRDRAGQLLELLALAEHQDALGASLSQGMRRKVALAMVLLQGAQVLLLDEPFNGLDPQAQHELRVLLRRLCDEQRTLVMSTHRLGELARLTNSFAVLTKGRLVARGDLDQLRAQAQLPAGSDVDEVYLALAG